MRIALLGPPGAGKSTQAERLAAVFHLVHLSSGDLLRAEKTAGTPLGRRVRQFLDQGVLVPDDLLVQLVQERVRGAREGFILDGYPRTLAQARMLDSFLDGEDMPLDLVLIFTLEAAVLTRRFAGRRICPKCGTVYHLDSRPPLVPEHCDRDDAALTLRPDDAPETVRRRLETYQETMAPVLAYFTQRKLLATMDASGSIDAVAEQAVRMVRRHFDLTSKPCESL